MPRVRSATSLGLGNIQAKQGPTVYQQAYDTGSDQIAQAVQRFGGNLQQVADLQFKRELQVKDENDELEAISLDNELSGHIRTLLNDPDNGELTRRGKLASGGTKRVETALNDLNRDISGRASNPEVLRRLQRRMAQRADSALTQISRHESNQRRVYADEVAQAAMIAAGDDAIANYTDPKEVAKHLARSETAIRTAGKTNGRSAEVIDLAVKQEKSRVYSAIITRHLDDDSAGSMARARSLMSEHWNELTGKDRVVLQSKIRQASIITDAQDLAAKAFQQNMTPEQRLQWIRDQADGKLEEKALDLVRQQQGDRDRTIARRRADLAAWRAAKNFADRQKAQKRLEENIKIDDANKQADRLAVDLKDANPGASWADLQAKLKSAGISDTVSGAKLRDLRNYMAGDDQDATRARDFVNGFYTENPDGTINQLRDRLKNQSAEVQRQALTIARQRLADDDRSRKAANQKSWDDAMGYFNRGVALDKIPQSVMAGMDETTRANFNNLYADKAKQQATTSSPEAIAKLNQALLDGKLADLPGTAGLQLSPADHTKWTKAIRDEQLARQQGVKSERSNLSTIVKNYAASVDEDDKQKIAQWTQDFIAKIEGVKRLDKNRQFSQTELMNEVKLMHMQGELNDGRSVFGLLNFNDPDVALSQAKPWDLFRTNEGASGRAGFIEEHAIPAGLVRELLNLSSLAGRGSSARDLKATYDEALIFRQFGKIGRIPPNVAADIIKILYENKGPGSVTINNVIAVYKERGFK